MVYLQVNLSSDESPRHRNITLKTSSIPSFFFAVTRSVRDIDNNKRRRYLYTILLPSNNPSDNTNAATVTAAPFVPPPVETHASIQWRLPSPSGAKIAILRNEDGASNASNNSNGGNGDASSKTQILEIWVDYGQALQRRIRLPSKQHGKVISDPGGFGRPSWNVQETALVYPAERKAPETSSFFDDDDDDNDNDNDNTVAAVGGAESTATTTTTTKQRGGQHTLGIGKFERWGEKYSQQSPLIDLYCVHVKTGKIGKVENVPGASQSDDKKKKAAAAATTSEGGYSLGQPVFSPNGQNIVYAAWDAGAGSEMPRRLGLIYCQQRPSKLYTSSIKCLMKQLSSEQNALDDENETESDEGFDVLSPDFRLARSPRFAQMDNKSEASTLVFLASKDGFDTHAGCFALHTMEWNKGGPSLDTLRTVVKQVWDPRDSSPEYGRVAGLRFPGLFLQELPEPCFLSPEFILATTQWGSTTKVVRISLENGKVDLVPCGEECSSSALVCITPKGGAIIHSKAPNDPGALNTIPANVLLEEFLPKDCSQCHCLVRLKPISATRFSALEFDSFPFTYSIKTEEAAAVEGVNFDLPLQSLLLLPEKSDNTKPPLIVVPHGGPHSALCSNYIHSYAFLCGRGGYAVLMVNYRGSTGFGQGSVEALPRFIGDLDVIDVVSVTKQVIESGLVDPNRVGICGGSHGGFLAGHCTSQYPGLFKVAAMRNPVVNIPSMTTATDVSLLILV